MSQILSQYQKLFVNAHIKPLIDILSTYILIFTVILLSLEFSHNFFSFSLTFLAFSFLFHRLALFLHAAAHHEFHEDKFCSDLLYYCYLGWFFGIDIVPFRKIHWDHHRLHGKSGNDPEDTYSKGLDFKTIVNMILKLDNKHKVTKNRNKARKLSIFFLMAQSLLISYIFFYGGFLPLLSYLLALSVGLPIVVHLRNCLEHTPLDGISVSRNFQEGLISYFLGGAGFSLHAEHHLYPNVRYWELKETTPRNSYIRTLKELFKYAYK